MIRKFEIYQDGLMGLWFWRLCDEHGKVLCRSLVGEHSTQTVEARLRSLSLDFAYSKVIQLQKVDLTVRNQ